MNISNVIKPLLVTLSISLVSSCTDIQEYPAEWPKPLVIQKDTCKFLDGTYSDLASDDSGSRLVSLLSGNSKEPLEHADCIQIMTSDNHTLSFIAYSGEKVVARYEYSAQARTLECGSGMPVKITISNGMVAAEGVLGYSKIIVSLEKDNEGYLLVKREEVAVGAYAIIPIIGKSVRWHKYKPL